MLTIQQVKDDILEIEKKFSSIYITKLIWTSDSLVPKVEITKNPTGSDFDFDYDSYNFEHSLGKLYMKYLQLFPHEESRFSMYKKYYDKHYS